MCQVISCRFPPYRFIKPHCSSAFVVTILLIIFTSIDAVLFMRLVKQMHNYTFLLSQLIYPMGFTLVTWFLSLIYYRDRICCLRGSKCRRRKPAYQSVVELDPIETMDPRKKGAPVIVDVMQGPTNVHDEEDENSAQEELDDDKYTKKDKSDRPPAEFSIRQHWRIILSFTILDTLTTTLAILPILYLPSVLLLLFGQLTLPLNLFFSKFILHRGFKNTHYYGALVVLLGVIVASYADIHSSSVQGDGKMMFFWAGLLTIVKFIDAGSGIYREHMLKKHNLKAWHTTVWVSLFQSVLSVLLLPVILIPFPPPWMPISLDQMELYIRNAFHCLFGQPLEVNTIPFPNSSLSPSFTNPSPSPSTQDLCVHDNNLILFLAFLFFNIILNVMSLVLTKLKSSNYTILVSALRIGLTSFLLSQEWLAGLAYHALVFLQVLGAFVILSGMLVYSSQPLNEEETDIVAPKILLDDVEEVAM